MVSEPIHRLDSNQGSNYIAIIVFISGDLKTKLKDLKCTLDEELIVYIQMNIWIIIMPKRNNKNKNAFQ